MKRYATPSKPTRRVPAIEVGVLDIIEYMPGHWGTVTLARSADDGSGTRVIEVVTPTLAHWLGRFAVNEYVTKRTL